VCLVVIGPSLYAITPSIKQIRGPPLYWRRPSK
jgi:hypothetical protein